MKAHGGSNLWEKPTASGAKWWMTEWQVPMWLNGKCQIANDQK